MSRSVIFDPLLPLPVLWVLAALAALMLGFAIWRSLRGWPLRALALAALGVALLKLRHYSSTSLVLPRARRLSARPSIARVTGYRIGGAVFIHAGNA